MSCIICNKSFCDLVTDSIRLFVYNNHESTILLTINIIKKEHKNECINNNKRKF
jgi:hypothetical protein